MEAQVTREEEDIMVAEVALDLFETLLREDYSYSGSDKIHVEVEVNLHATGEYVKEAFGKAKTTAEALEILIEEVDRLKRVIKERIS